MLTDDFDVDLCERCEYLKNNPDDEPCEDCMYMQNGFINAKNYSPKKHSLNVDIDYTIL